MNPTSRGRRLARRDFDAHRCHIDGLGDRRDVGVGAPAQLGRAGNSVPHEELINTEEPHDEALQAWQSAVDRLDRSRSHEFG
jgi:hypothetical protein